MIQANTMNEKPSISFPTFNSDTYFPVLPDADKEIQPIQRNPAAAQPMQEQSTPKSQQSEGTCKYQLNLY